MTPSTRRTFLQRAAKAGTAAALLTGGGLALHRRQIGQAGEAAAFEIPSFAVDTPGARVAVAHGAQRDQTLRAALQQLGGMKRFIQPGDRVLLKVNAAFAVPAQLGATTHPDLVRALVRSVQEAGASRVIVSDNPINDPQSCFALSGIEAAAGESGAELLLPRSGFFRDYSVPGARLIHDWPLLTEPLQRVNKVIGVAPVKHHARSGASMTLKNWYGLLGGRRNIFHQEIDNIIMELGMMIRPTLVVLDGTVSMMRNGPTGGSLDDLSPTGTLIAGTDPVAVDRIGAGLLGLTPEQLPYLSKAAEKGVGSLEPADVKEVTV